MKFIGNNETEVAYFKFTKNELKLIQIGIDALNQIDEIVFANKDIKISCFVGGSGSYLSLVGDIAQTINKIKYCGDLSSWDMKRILMDENCFTINIASSDYKNHITKNSYYKKDASNLYKNFHEIVLFVDYITKLQEEYDCYTKEYSNDMSLELIEALEEYRKIYGFGSSEK